MGSARLDSTAFAAVTVAARSYYDWRSSGFQVFALASPSGSARSSKCCR